MSEVSRSPRYFAVIEPRLWTENRFYRLYVTSEELVGVWAGRTNDLAPIVAMQGGLIGSLIVAAVSSRKKGGSRAEELDAKSFEELRTDHKQNFTLRINEIESAEIVPASFWFRLNYSSINQVGLLRLSLRGRKRLVLAIPSNDDMRTALDLLLSNLGQKLQVELCWDETRRKYRRVEAASSV